MPTRSVVAIRCCCCCCCCFFCEFVLSVWGANCGFVRVPWPRFVCPPCLGSCGLIVAWMAVVSHMFVLCSALHFPLHTPLFTNTNHTLPHMYYVCLKCCDVDSTPLIPTNTPQHAQCIVKHPHTNHHTRQVQRSCVGVCGNTVATARARAHTHTHTHTHTGPASHTLRPSFLHVPGAAVPGAVPGAVVPGAVPLTGAAHAVPVAAGAAPAAYGLPTPQGTV